MKCNVVNCANRTSLGYCMFTACTCPDLYYKYNGWTCSTSSAVNNYNNQSNRSIPETKLELLSMYGKFGK